jgi:UDP-N-acetylmuramate dehydrogenase
MTMRGSYFQRRICWTHPFRTDEPMADLDELKAMLGPRLKQHEPLRLHTSFRIGGPADALALVNDSAELKACLDWAAEARLPVFVLAAGTNLLVRDGGLRGLAVKLEGEFKDVSIDGSRVRGGAGALLAAVARRAGERGLSGLEWAVGIPGTLGGGLVMNAGAHGGDLAQVARRLGLLEAGELREISAAEAGFGYRSSRFKAGGALLLWAELELKPGDPLEIQARMREALDRRKASQPLELPNAGCVFKNPAGGSAGQLIEAAGLKGLRRGGAEISELHANFVVNRGDASAADVLWLMEEARKAVLAKSGIRLESEILVLGEEA